jgi:hypothetical protein
MARSRAGQRHSRGQHRERSRSEGSTLAINTPIQSEYSAAVRNSKKTSGRVSGVPKAISKTGTAIEAKMHGSATRPIQLSRPLLMLQLSSTFASRTRGGDERLAVDDEPAGGGDRIMEQCHSLTI